MNRIAIVIIVISLALIPFSIFINKSLGNDNYKSLVDPSKSDYFNIYDSDYNFKASVQCTNNITRYDVLVEESPYTEEGTKSYGKFKSYDYYYENEYNQLTYQEDDASVIVDDFGVPVRYYWYDSTDGSLYWYAGVEDLDSIEYSKDQGIYHLINMDDEDNPEYYVKKYQKNKYYEVITTFYIGYNRYSDMELYQIEITHLNKDNQLVSTTYTTDIKGIELESTIDEINNFFKTNDMIPDHEEIYTYYPDTWIPTKIDTYSLNTDTGEIKHDEKSFGVYEKNGYFVQYEINLHKSFQSI